MTKFAGKSRNVSTADDTNVNMFTVDSRKPQLVRRKTVTNIVGCNRVRLVHRSTLQRQQSHVCQSMRHVGDVYAVPVLLRQFAVRGFLVEDAQTADTNRFAVLHADVSAIVRHDAAVGTKHWRSRTLWAITRHDTTFNHRHEIQVAPINPGDCRTLCHGKSRLRHCAVTWLFYETSEDPSLQNCSCPKSPAGTVKWLCHHNWSLYLLTYRITNLF